MLLTVIFFSLRLIVRFVKMISYNVTNYLRIIFTDSIEMRWFYVFFFRFFWTIFSFDRFNCYYHTSVYPLQLKLNEPTEECICG